MSSSRKSAPVREPLDINLDCKEYVLSGSPDKTHSRGLRSISRSARSSGLRSPKRRSRIDSAVVTSCKTADLPSARWLRTAAITVGSFMLRRSCPKNRCFVDSKRERADALAPLLRVAFSRPSTTEVSSRARSMLRWMMLYREVAIMRRNVAKARKAAEHFATSFTLFHKASSHSIRLASRFHEGGTLLAAGAPTCSSAFRLVSRLACA